MERKQFTFYESFYRAMRKIKNKAVRADIFDAICVYALYEDVPDENVIHPVALAIFEMAKPVLDTARKKAGGPSGKITERSKEDQAKIKQRCGQENGKEKENEKEKELEIEIERESEQAGARFEIFWKAYPKKVDRKSAWAAFRDVQEDLQVLLDALRVQKNSSQWLEEGGRFVPRAAVWLREKRWEDELPARVPMGATGQLGQAELDAIKKMLAEE